MSNWADYHDIGEAIKDLSERFSTLSDYDQNQALARVIGRMRAYLADLTLPETTTWGNAASSDEQAIEQISWHRTQQYSNQRRELVNTLDSLWAYHQHANADYCPQACFSVRAPLPMLVDRLATLWNQDARSLTLASDSSIESDITHRQSLLTVKPDEVISTLGLGTTTGDPIQYNITYAPFMDTRAGESVRHMQVHDALWALEDYNVALNELNVPSTEVRVFVDTDSGQTLMVRHSATEPEVVYAAMRDREPVALPAPPVAEAMGLADPDDPHLYGASVMACAARQPMKPAALDRELTQLEAWTDQLEAADPAQMVGDETLRDAYRDWAGHVSKSVLSLAEELDPLSSDHQQSMLRWSKLVSRLGIDDGLPIHFHIAPAGTLSGPVVPEAAFTVLSDDSGPTGIALYPNGQGDFNADEIRFPASKFSDASGQFDSGKFSRYLKAHDIAAIRGPTLDWQRASGSDIEYASVNLTTDTGLKAIGGSLKGDIGFHSLMSPFYATDRSQRYSNPDHPRSEDELARRMEDTVEHVAAIGMRYNLTGSDLGIAEERVGGLLYDEDRKIVADISFDRGMEFRAEFAQNSTIGTWITPLDLVYGDTDNLKHRLAVASATADNVDQQSRLYAVNAIKDLKDAELDDLVQTASQDRLENDPERQGAGLSH